MKTVNLLENVVMVDDLILVEPIANETVSRGGVILPGQEDVRPQMGTVVKVGPGKMREDGKREPSQVRVGLTVMFRMGAGVNIKLEHRDYIVLKENDLLLYFS